MENKVKISLSNPLSPKDAQKLDLPEREYHPRETVVVRADLAPMIINSGMAAVDPEDKDAVRSALKPDATLAKVPCGLYEEPAPRKVTGSGSASA